MTVICSNLNACDSKETVKSLSQWVQLIQWNPTLSVKIMEDLTLKHTHFLKDKRLNSQRAGINHRAWRGAPTYSAPRVLSKRSPDSAEGKVAMERYLSLVPWHSVSFLLYLGMGPPRPKRGHFVPLGASYTWLIPNTDWICQASPNKNLDTFQSVIKSTWMDR